MSAKRAWCTPADCGGKKMRKTITLETKLEVLRRFDDGQRAVDIGRALGLQRTTVQTICSHAEKFKARAQSVSPPTATKLNQSRSSIMENMERPLNVWMENVHQQNTPCSLTAVQMEALSLFEEIKKQQGSSAESESFVASHGWFERFKNRSKLQMTGESASGDKVAAAAYPVLLKKIINEGGYTPQQIFNVDETGLLWKRMPKRTFIIKEEKTAPGFKAATDRLTLLLGGNASGDLKLKPLAVYHSETPRAMKGYSKSHLPIIWRSTKKGWITRTVFQDWFSSYFCPAVKEYCRAKNIGNKALLLLDRAPCHPPNLDDLTDNVQVAYLPPNTSSLIQPMDQGVIATFKAYYSRRTFKQLITFLDDETKPSVRELCGGYHIMNAIDNLSEAWREVKTSTMNLVWHKIYPECVADFLGFEEPIQNVHQEIVELACQVGFNEEDVVELLKSDGEELSKEEMEQQCGEEEEDDETEEAETPRILTTKDLSEAFQLLDKAMAIFTEKDPQRERSAEANRVIMNGYNCYKELYKQKKNNARQTLIHQN